MGLGAGFPLEDNIPDAQISTVNLQLELDAFEKAESQSISLTDWDKNRIIVLKTKLKARYLLEVA